MFHFLIVTPCRNAERWIGETIASIVTQVGDFGLRYHVQDGGSSDQTLSLVREWQQVVRDGRLPGLNPRIEFSIAEQKDRGMYDALDRAFAFLQPEPSDWLGWLNADDRLQPGCLQTIVEIIERLPDVRWLGGRSMVVTKDGALRPLTICFPHPQTTLRAGLHESRHLPFIMQEGTFFRADLLADVGGFDAEFRLAGDWDLWRRFAAVAPYHAVNVSFASHRRHPHQLSNAMDKYYAELDEALGERGRQERDRVWQSYNNRLRFQRGSIADMFKAPMIDNLDGTWRIVENSTVTRANRLFAFEAISRQEATASVADVLAVLPLNRAGTEGGGSECDAPLTMPKSITSDESAYSSWSDLQKRQIKSKLRAIRDKRRLIVTQSFLPSALSIGDADILPRRHLLGPTSEDARSDLYLGRDIPSDVLWLDRLRHRETPGLLASWIWEDDRLAPETFRAANSSDVCFFGQSLRSPPLWDTLSIDGGHVPLCAVPWSLDDVTAAATRALLNPRSDRLYGGLMPLRFTASQNALVDGLQAVMPSFIPFEGPFPDPVYDGAGSSASDVDRLVDWMQYKVTLCSSLDHRVPSRVFEVLLTGGIPLILGQPPDLDSIFTPHMQEELPIVVLETVTPEAVAAAHRLCLDRFDADGQHGVMMRHEYIKGTHMPRHRLAQIIDRLRGLAEIHGDGE